MIRGAFASLRHVHDYRADAGAVVMTDTISWRSPLGVLGTLADAIVVGRHLRNFLIKKQAGVKELSERLAADKVMTNRPKDDAAPFVASNGRARGGS